jgi:eukaryotic-like serine/threonine-protein kinase
MRIWQSDVAGRNGQFTQVGPAQRLAWIYTEMGDRPAAGKVAHEFLVKMKAWTEPAGGGASIGLLPFALRAGAISKEDLERERKDWQEKLRANWASTRGTGPALDWNLWIGAYACMADTPEEATEALGHMPTSPPPPAGGRTLDFDACFGKTLLLAKQYDRAIDPLRRVAHSCGALSVPFHYMQSQINLGLALESSGDKEGAKVFYRMVVDLWGKARPRSVTAEAAQARLLALEPTKPAVKKDSAKVREDPVDVGDSGYSVSGRQTSRGSLPSVPKSGN